jgi:hypothetical protein
MTWQQPGQQSSGQPGFGYASQPGQPFSGQPGYGYPPQAGFRYPGMGGPQAQAPIPPAVSQAAEATGLGAPTREYSKGASSAGSNALASSLSISLIIGLGIGGLGLLAGLAAALIFAPFPFNLLTVGIIVVCILPFLPMLIKLTRGVFGGGGAGGLRFWGCPNGLVYQQSGQISTMRWEDVAQVWRTSAMVNGILSTTGYRVQLSNGQSFGFSMLGGPYAGLMNAFGGAGSMSISSGAGQMSNYGGFTEISGQVDLSAYAGLGDLIEEQMVSRQMPRALDAFRSGAVLSFGQFSVQRQGLSDGMRPLAWSEIADIQVSGAAIQITKKPSSLVWFNLSVAALPNVALLVALLTTIRGGQV